MPASAGKKPNRATKEKLPIRCKTWREVEELREKFGIKPVRYGPKGQPIWDLAEVEKYIILPTEPR